MLATSSSSSPSPKAFPATSSSSSSSAPSSAFAPAGTLSSAPARSVYPPSYSPRTLRKTSIPSSPRNPTTRSSTSSAASSNHLLRSPRRPTADASTQYSPNDWPPTSSRSSLRRKPSVPIRERPAPDQPLQPSALAGAPSHAPAPSAVAHDSLARAPQEASAAASAKGRITRQTPQTSLASSRSNLERAASPVGNTLNTPAAKRARPSTHPPQVLPVEYKDCPPKTLATLISGLLMDLIQHNDKIQLQDTHLTRFHSRTPPGISVHDYLQRLTLHATLPPPILLAVVFYIDRLCAAFEPFTINSLTVHRFLIAAATVAAKGLMDVFWTNSTYAKVGGVSLKELALLELELLVRVEWRIIPDTTKLAEYYRGLVQRHPDFVLDEAGSSSELSADSMETDSPEQDHGQEDSA